MLITRCMKNKTALVSAGTYGVKLVVMYTGMGEVWCTTLCLSWRLSKSVNGCVCFSQSVVICSTVNVVNWGNEAPLLLLLFNGDPLDVTFAQQSPQVSAIISCVYPAQATGEALYRTLTATGPHAVPAARLPNTWPAVLHQVVLLGLAAERFFRCP